jgi:DNA polymerase-1
LRSQAERAGINTPIQGTAADLIKKAMIAVHHRLKNENLKAQIILQVHDELVIETPEVEVGKIKNILKTEMENIHKLDIPLEVSISVGHNWSDMQ